MNYGIGNIVEEKDASDTEAKEAVNIFRLRGFPMEQTEEEGAKMEKSP